MCIVIDINTLAHVFDETSAKHKQFSCVRSWIDRRQGVLVFGGTKFLEELEKAGRYLRLIRQMKDAGLAVAIVGDLVDSEQARITKLTEGTDCDDQHIIALLGVSRCPLICSLDKRAYPFFRDRSLYPRGMTRVRIYSSNRNQSLLRPTSPSSLRNIA